jgi:hypothetical protein
LQGLLERIGVDNPAQEAFTVTALRMPIEDELREYVNIHDNMDELNMLASFVDDMEDYELDQLQAILQTGVADLSKGSHNGRHDIAAVINLIYEDNFTAFDFIYAHNEEALGRYYADENDEIPDGVSFAEYGKQCVKDEGGRFVKELDGYIKHMHKSVAVEYDGKIPDEYKIVDSTLRAMQFKKLGRGAELGSGEKPSVLDEIKASRQDSRNSKARAASKAKDQALPRTPHISFGLPYGTDLR